MEREYVLGTGDNELERLGFQNRVWAAQAALLWERAGFGPGSAVIDAGCGPGYTTLDLAHLVGARGRILALDESQRFIAHLQRACSDLRLAQVEAQVADLQSADLPAQAFDGAYLRWVLCFVPDPTKVISRLAAALRPGGRLVMQDYFYYRGIRLLPGGPAFDAGIEAVCRSWRGRGGDDNVGQRLPALLVQAGFSIREIQPQVRTARPGTPLWGWPVSFFKNFLPMLVEQGQLTAQASAEFMALWSAHAGMPDAVFFTPPMVDIIAVKEVA